MKKYLGLDARHFSSETNGGGGSISEAGPSLSDNKSESQVNYFTMESSLEEDSSIKVSDVKDLWAIIEGIRM